MDSSAQILDALPGRGARVVIGLSGGVDSAVAALRLVDAGCEVTAVTTRNFCFDEAPFDAASAARSCCSLEAIEAAGALAADLGIGHVVVDATTDFRREVIDDYVEEYASGRTPSPCVRCNARVRFPTLLDFARKIDADFVASGHYARRVRIDGEIFVARGADPGKDQSYYLYRIPPERLEKMVLPLGELTKEEVRGIASRRGLPVAATPDSQELCFVPDGDRRPLLGPGQAPGSIVDRDGEVLGEHDGIAFFTVGQRRGLGLGGGPVRVVVELDAGRNRVVVGGEEDLLRSRLVAGDWVDRDPFPGRSGLRCRTRARHDGIAIAGLRARGEDGEREILLEVPDRAPAPGQAVVLDRDGVIVAGGRLLRAD